MNRRCHCRQDQAYARLAFLTLMADGLCKDSQLTCESVTVRRGCAEPATPFPFGIGNHGRPAADRTTVRHHGDAVDGPKCFWSHARRQTGPILGPGKQPGLVSPFPDAALITCFSNTLLIQRNSI